MPATRMQVKLNAPPERVFHALTDSVALQAWFAEHADVSVADGRYDFWGRYTPDKPDRETGRHKLIASEANKRLRYAWRVKNGDQVLNTEVEFTLHPQGDETILALHHEGAGGATDQVAESFLEDFWFLHLENLRRYIAGKPSEVRIDFSDSMLGDVTHFIDIDAPPSAVFEVLLKPEQLNRWIASGASVEPRVGGGYDYGWGEMMRMKIVELESDEKLKLSWQGEGTPEILLTWTLEESGGKTRLTMVNSGFAPDTDNSGIYKGWWNYLNWIRGLAEEGAAWRSPLLPLTEDKKWIYPAVVWERQAELVA